MSKTNPAGTMFVGLIEELMDVLKDPSNSSVEVIMASFDSNATGDEKLVDGKLPVSIRAFEISGIDKNVRDSLRAEYDAAPLALLMIVYTTKTSKGSGVRSARFAEPGTDTKALANTALVQYAQRHPPK
jgi:hypothetical protein